MPILPLRGVAMLAAGLAVLGAIAFLVDWELRAAALMGNFSSARWEIENSNITAENYKKAEATSTMPLFRSAGYAPPPPVAGRRRILVVGDSFIWGHGHTNINTTWWRQLSWELERRGYRQVDVVAAGLNGASTQDQLGWLRNPAFLAAARPDLIVFGYVTNDPLIRDAAGHYLVKAKIPPKARAGEESVLPALRHELATRAARAAPGNDEVGYYYTEWELKLLEGENFRRYRAVLKDLSATLRELAIPTFFVTTPNLPDESYYAPRYSPVRAAFNEAGLEFVDLLPPLQACCKETTPNPFAWGINPGNNHPGQKLTRFFARQVADILEKSYSAVLGATGGGSEDWTPAINDWMPASARPRHPDATTWKFTYTGAAHELLRMPVDVPHVALNFERPVSMRSLKLSSPKAGTFKVWVTVLDDKEGFEDKRYVPIGESHGKEVEMTLPLSLWQSRITSLRISSDAPPHFETIAQLTSTSITPESGLNYAFAMPHLLGQADDSQHPRRSPFVLLEDGKPLGPAHSLHEDIRKQGKGRHSHWDTVVFFSSSDGSDPRTNGRRYTLARHANEVSLQISFNSPAVRL